ncbi:MAG: transcription-repair coupling factor [Clostridiaceae bacterium]|nr:transcription-repair coupling factor [Clostridiaceae bacterium]
MQRIRDGTVTAVGGLSLPHKAHVIAAVRRFTGRPLAVVCADELECRRLSADLSVLSGEEVALLPYREPVFVNVESASREWEILRLRTLYGLVLGTTPIVVTTPDALLLRTMSPDTLRARSLTLKLGQTIEPKVLAAHLVASGYTRCDRVEGYGQFALRGGIVDVYSPAHASPVRVDFFGDEIDAMGFFDPDSQRRTENTDTCVVIPAREALPDAAPGGAEGLAEAIRKLISASARRKKIPEGLLDTLHADLERLKETGLFPALDRYLPQIYPELHTAYDFLPRTGVLFLDETGRIRERAEGFAWQMNEDIKNLLESGVITPSQTEFARDYDALAADMPAKATVMLESFISGALIPRPRAILTIIAKQLPSYGGSLETAVSDVQHYKREGYATIVLATSDRRAEHLESMLSDTGARIDFNLAEAPAPGTVTVGIGNLSAGIEYPTAKLAVVTEGQIMAAQVTKKPRVAKKKAGEKIKSFSDLSPGDLIVHDQHGIGRFIGIEKIKTDNGLRDYIRLQYAGTDTLFIPATQLDMVSKYIGGGGEETQARLNKLGGSEWQKTKSRAKAAAKDMAKKLIAIYAERKRRPGFKFPKDDAWQKEFEDAFEYTETDAQLRCTAEIKADMEESAPMDRLLCGDVGFGKTEVAFRAIMKCVLTNKQAAILVPTTVLARQHYMTAVRRFSGYPVKIAVLSRFQSPTEVREIQRKLSSGLLDVIVGTHKLLSKDLRFHDLGLLVIDEEQRFGVTHKERLRDIARNVDTLTMTATPIPRTLNMALTGVRDMSTLEEAPRDRQPVQTYVLEYDAGVIFDAIRREATRGGQVYYLYNRVETIERCAAKLKAALPDISIAVAHGQMSEDALSEVMRAMSDGELQVLVCTTIIETGIDIPNVNTLIIEDADRLGLAQLHQIRGRVGRSPRHAYAYLTYKRGKVLTEDGSKRLSAMREFAGFGAGFQIALRDLEIRGAGNILGTEQSGHMTDVGYDMYLRLLEEAVLEERGEQVQKRPDCSAELAVTAHIPEDYVPIAEERMDLYRRIAFIKEKDDAEDVTDELCDRYGEPPAAVQNLISIAMLRADASRANITDITQKNGTLMLTLASPDFEAIGRLCALPTLKGRVLLNAGEKPYISVRLRLSDKPLELARMMIAAYTKP